MDQRLADIKRRVSRAGDASEEDLDAVDEILETEGPTTDLLILRGQLLQLLAGENPDELEEAFACYQEALEIDPSSAAAHEEIGHFLDDVADDPAEAVHFFRKAIELGAGPSAKEGLREALRQLDSEEP